MARVSTDGDFVRLRVGLPMLAFALTLYLGLPVVFGLIGIDCLVHGVADGDTALLGAGLGFIVIFVAGGAYLWHSHFWDEAVEASATELRLRRKGRVVHRIDRDRLGATSFTIGEMGSTGKHRLSVYDHDGEKLGAWPLRLGYDGLQTKPFYLASGVPDATLLRELYQQRTR